MQNSTQGTHPTHSAHAPAQVTYRERLTPSLGVFMAAVIVAPMVMLVLVRVDQIVALAIGVLVAVLVIVLLIVTSPVIAVRGEWLYAGRARIDARYLGHPEQHRGPDARRRRGTDFDPRSWHLIRGGVDGVVTVPVEDPADPVPVWVLSSRTPDRLAAAIDAARVRRRTPGR